VLHDLGNDGDKAWGLEPPYRALGASALHAAGPDFAQGSVGAGRGAMAGLMKGGIGSASIDLGGGLIVGALAAVNSVGSALMPDGVTYWAWPFELNGEFGASNPPGAQPDVGNPAPDESRMFAQGRLHPGANTTLGVVACSAALTTAECTRVAMMAQDGIARAVRPAHSLLDGDTVFALASGTIDPGEGQWRAIGVSRIGSAAADCMSRAIARAVHRSRARPDAPSR
jgi:L-aminopeptidase/D-esterase-like protein